jgi:hypothetical protein
MPSAGSTSTSVYRRRSPSLAVPPGAPASRRVAVLSCCTHPALRELPPWTGGAGLSSFSWPCGVLPRPVPGRSGLAHPATPATPRRWSSTSQPKWSGRLHRCRARLSSGAVGGPGYLRPHRARASITAGMSLGSAREGHEPESQPDRGIHDRHEENRADGISGYVSTNCGQHEATAFLLRRSFFEIKWTTLSPRTEEAFRVVNSIVACTC